MYYTSLNNRLFYNIKYLDIDLKSLIPSVLWQINVFEVYYFYKKNKKLKYLEALNVYLR